MLFGSAIQCSQSTIRSPCIRSRSIFAFTWTVSRPSVPSTFHQEQNECKRMWSVISGSSHTCSAVEHGRVIINDMRRKARDLSRDQAFGKWQAKLEKGDLGGHFAHA